MAHHRVTTSTGSITECVATRALNAEHGANLAGANVVDVLHLVRVHPHEARDLDLLPSSHVRDDASLAESALVDPDVGKLAVAAFFELEGERDEGGVGGRGEGLRGVGGGDDGESEGGNFFGSREVEANSVEDGLDRLVREGGSEKDRGELESDRCAANGRLVSRKKVVFRKNIQEGKR